MAKDQKNETLLLFACLVVVSSSFLTNWGKELGLPLKVTAKVGLLCVLLHHLFSPESIIMCETFSLGNIIIVPLFFFSYC